MAIYPGPLSQSLDGISFKLYQTAQIAAQQPTCPKDTLTALYHLTASTEYIRDTLTTLNINSPTPALTQAITELRQALADIEKGI